MEKNGIFNAASSFRGEIVFYNSFYVELVPEEIVWNKIIIANIFQVQANNSVMCGNFCIGFIDFMLAGKKLTDFTSMTNSASFKYKTSITRKTSNANQENRENTQQNNTKTKKNLEIVVPLKNLSNLWRNLKMPLINCEVSLTLTWLKIVFWLILKQKLQEQLEEVIQQDQQ